MPKAQARKRTPTALPYNVAEARGAHQIKIRQRRTQAEYEAQFEELQGATWFQEYAALVSAASDGHIKKSEATRKRLKITNRRWAIFHENEKSRWHHFMGREWAEDDILGELRYRPCFKFTQRRPIRMCQGFPEHGLR